MEGTDPAFSWWCDEWESGAWEPQTLAVIDRFVVPGTVMLDVGAWIGPTSLWALRHGGVVAVEPDPVASRHLSTNLRINHRGPCTAPAGLIEAAVTDEEGRCCIAPHEGWGSSMTRVAEAGTEVRSTTLAYLLDLAGVGCSLVKMDIEGGESRVLEAGAPHCARLGVPMLVAMHEPWWHEPVQREWFKDFSSVEGVIGGWNQVLAIP
jgi:FkbM family methyltransferase